jgi:hypothetical protein
MQISIGFENEKFLIDSSKNVKVKDFFNFIRKKYNTNEHNKFLLIGENQMFDENLLENEILTLPTINSSPIRQNLNSNFLKAGQNLNNKSKIDFVLLSIDNYDEEKEEKSQINNFSFSEESKNHSNSILSKEDLIMKVTGADEPIKLDLRRNLKRRPAIRHNYFGNFMGLNFLPRGDNLRYNPFEPNLWNAEEDLSEDEEPLVDMNNQGEIINTNSQAESSLNDQNTFLGRPRERDRNPSEILSRRSRLYQSLFFSPISTSINANTGVRNIISTSVQNLNNQINENSSHILNSGLTNENDPIQSDINYSAPSFASASGSLYNRPSWDEFFDHIPNDLPSRSAPLNIRQSDVDRLVSEMGFEEGRVRTALRYTRNNVNRAVDILLNGPESIFDESEAERQEQVEVRNNQDNQPELELHENIQEGGSDILNVPNIPNFFDFSRRERLNQQSFRDNQSAPLTMNYNILQHQHNHSRFHRNVRTSRNLLPPINLQNRSTSEMNESGVNLSNLQENNNITSSSQEAAEINHFSENNDYSGNQGNQYAPSLENIENPNDEDISQFNEEPIQPIESSQQPPLPHVPGNFSDEEDQSYTLNNINEVEMEEIEENSEFRLNDEEDDYDLDEYENQENFADRIPESESSSQMDS